MRLNMSNATKARNRRRVVILVTAAAVPLLWLARHSSASDAPAASATVTAAGEAKEVASTNMLIAVAPPPFSDGIFPCSECHDGKDVNTKRRVVDDHEDIILEHDKENRWCLDCHDTVNRDKLHLADGRLLDFKESYLLCGQCHGPTLRDWRAGEHGKRTGSWSGQKQYLLCVNCHNPHSPKFKPLKPMPPPVRPEALR